MFSKLFGKSGSKHRWPPLYCQMRDIIALMEECIRIDAPIMELTFQYKEQPHKIGLSSDHEPKKGYFDIEFYLDKQIFYSMKDFLDKAEIDSCKLLISTIRLLYWKQMTLVTREIILYWPLANSMIDTRGE